jgi:hypothetical protein
MPGEPTTYRKSLPVPELTSRPTGTEFPTYRNSVPPNYSVELLMLNDSDQSAFAGSRGGF